MQEYAYRSDIMLFRPAPQLVKNTERAAAEVGDLVGHGDRLIADHRTFHHTHRLHLVEPLGDHLLACPTELTNQIVESYRPVLDRRVCRSLINKA